MPGAVKQARPAFVSSKLRPTVQWAWLIAPIIGVLIAAIAVPWAQPIGANDTPVIAADAALGRAIGAGDESATRRLLALQFVSIDVEGKIHNRKDVLADLKGLAAGAASDVQERNYGLLSVVIGRRPAAHDLNVFFLEVWAKQKGAWRALAIQDVARNATIAPPIAVPAAGAQPYQCRNPCEGVPYRVRSPAEQEVVTTFQTLTKAVVAHASEDWNKQVADEFVAYRSGRAPLPKTERIAAIEREKESNAPIRAGEVQAMRLAVYENAALMLTTEAALDGSRPFYRAARVWVKRDGQWLLALCMETDVR